MARENRNKADNQPSTLMKDRSIRKNIRDINNMMSQASLSLYGTDRTSDVDSVNRKFQSLLTKEIETLTTKDNDDISSFLSKLWSQDRKLNAEDNILENQFLSMSGDEYNSMQSFITDAYRNRLLEQSDLHEVASQLIELSEAILITRDAIISPDVVEGRMSRTISFGVIDDEDSSDYVPVIETMEKKFKLLEKIKNFIIPKTLEYGEYYVYTIPYAKIFNDFMRNKTKHGYAGRIYRESTNVAEFIKEDDKKSGNKKSFGETVYKSYMESAKILVSNMTETNPEKQKYDKLATESGKKEFIEDISRIMEHVSVQNNTIPLPVLFEGEDSISQYMTEFVNESGDRVMTEAEKKDKSVISDNLFDKIQKNDGSQEGVTLTSDESNKLKSDFADIRDCYIKVLEPTKVIPIEIMNQVIGYYYVQSEDVTPLSGAISSTLYYSKFDESQKQQTIIGSIANKIVDSFDKDFLKNNLKFKETIVEAINYYNLNEKRLRFQFIPVDYMQRFKIDEDEEGHGQSMIRKSLFYAKLYLMLLLFKIMSIILYSNDQKVNYIKQSGIDKNIANKVQEIARIRQSRQINMQDLFNYTTLINKVGNGSEMYIPTGRSGERPIETEILQGQDVPLNSDLLEMLKNSYILGTGVPAAIVNYLNEADFAKVIEQNNTKFNGRVVNYQLDFNGDITDWYRKIAKWSTNIPENIIENLEFSLQPPKTNVANVKMENINNFTQTADFLINLLYGPPESYLDDPDIAEEIQIFRRKLAESELPYLKIDSIKDFMKDAKLEQVENKLKPNPKNGDEDNLEDLDATLAEISPE